MAVSTVPMRASCTRGSNGSHRTPGVQGRDLIQHPQTVDGKHEQAPISVEDTKMIMVTLIESRIFFHPGSLFYAAADECVEAPARLRISHGLRGVSG